jgi:transposase
VLVLDNGPIHTSKLSLTALAARAHWLTIEGLPKYGPELNDTSPSGVTSRRILSRIGPSLTSMHSTEQPSGQWERLTPRACPFHLPSRESLLS